MSKQKANYVDGFLFAVPKKNLAAYKKMAKEASKIWKKYGAIDYKECIGDDLGSQWGIPFPKITKLKKGEMVFFSYITYKSKKHRDQVNAKVMKDPFMDQYKDKPMPFDIKRMSFGGFKVLVSA